MARKRFQTGTLFLRGKHEKKWVARYREDVWENGRIVRHNRSVIVGTLQQFPTRKLALRAMQPLLNDINSPVYRPKVNISFEDFAEQWKSTVLTQLKPSTQASEKPRIKRLKAYFGQFPVVSVDARLIQSFVSTAGLHPKTLRNHIGTLSSMFTTALQWGLVDKNPCVGLTLPQYMKPEGMGYRIEDVIRILGAAQEPERTLYWILAETGMRPGEGCALTWDAVDLDNRIITVKQNTYHGNIQSVKSAKARRMFSISPGLAQHLKTVRPENANGLLFQYERNGRPWKPEKVVVYKLNPLLEQLGIEKPVHPLHAFRHSNATLLDRLNAPVKLRQDRLGHVDPRTTLGDYTVAVSEDDRRIAGEIGSILLPIAPKQEESLEAGA